MGRGLGRIGQAIARDIAYVDRTTGEPSTVQVSSWGLLCDVYNDPTDWEQHYKFTPAQRKAVVRAMHSFVRRHQQYALIGGQGRKRLYLYEPDDPLSAMWAKLQVANRKRNGVTRTQAKARLALEKVAA